MGEKQNYIKSARIKLCSQSLLGLTHRLDVVRASPAQHLTDA